MRWYDAALEKHCDLTFQFLKNESKMCKRSRAPSSIRNGVSYFGRFIGTKSSSFLFFEEGGERSSKPHCDVPGRIQQIDTRLPRTFPYFERVQNGGKKQRVPLTHLGSDSWVSGPLMKLVQGVFRNMITSLVCLFSTLNKFRPCIRCTACSRLWSIYNFVVWVFWMLLST